MKKVELRTFKEFVSDFAESTNIEYLEALTLITTKLKECHLLEVDIVCFINAVDLRYTCREIADSLGISINTVQYRLKKVRERFPQLRTFNKNLRRMKPFRKPKHLSRTDGERLPDGTIYHGSNIEINEFERFNENRHNWETLEDGDNESRIQNKF